MHLFTTNRFLAVLMLTGGSALTLCIWFGADNYYIDYEAIYSKLYSINMSCDEQFDAYEHYAPQAYIAYETLWNWLYEHSPKQFWYDYTMACCFLLISINLYVICRRYLSGSLSVFIQTIVYLALWLLLLHWTIRLQNITHTAYLLCLSSLAVFIGESHKLSPLSWYSLFSFLAGSCLRWEVGTISIACYYLFLFTDFKKLFYLPYHMPSVIQCIIAGYTWYLFACEPYFYRQIEPDGEYVVLYERALLPPSGANVIDSLRWQMLNQWIVDDTSLISTEVFKQFITAAKQQQNVQHYFNLWKHAMNDWWRAIGSKASLLVFILWLVVWHVEKKFRIAGMVFTLMVLLLLGVVSAKGILTMRHVEGILAGSTLLLLTNAPPRVYPFLAGLIVCASIRTVEITKELSKQRNLYDLRLQQAARIGHFATADCMIWTDAHYPELFLNKTMQKHPYQDCIHYLSFQQHSYSDQFRRYISCYFDTAQRYDIYFSRLADIGSYTILSPSRAAVYQTLLSRHYRVPLELREVEPLASTDDNLSPFSGARIWRVEKKRLTIIPSK